MKVLLVYPNHKGMNMLPAGIALISACLKREGHKVPLGTGLNKDGKETTDPGEIVDGGVLLPFGGYKGSGIAMMVELLAGALVGDNFSFETAAKDNKDGGPPSGGEFILAISPDKSSGNNWDKHLSLIHI